MGNRKKGGSLAFFYNLKIGVKIRVGYMVVLILAAIVGGLSIVQLDRVNATVTRLTGQLAPERALAEKTAAQIQRIRLYANQYMLGEQKPTDLDSYNQALADAQTLLDDADQTITEPDRVALQAQARSNFDKFASAFAEIVRLLAAREAIVSNVLTPQGAASVDKLAVLRNNGFEALDFTSANYASQARDTFALMQLSVIQYRATGDEQFANQVDDDYAIIRSTFDLLQASVRDAASRTLVNEIVGAAAAYYQGFQDIRGGVARQRDLIATQLDVNGPQVDQLASTIANDINDEFVVQSQTTSALVAQTHLIILMTIGLVVVVGLAFGATLSRAITRPIEQLARAAQGIAAGALDQEVQVQGNDELGILAGAFNHMSAALHRSLTSLQASERRYRALFETAPDAIWVLDKQSAQILDANPAACALYGYGQDEIRQLSALDVSAEASETRRAIQESVSYIPLRYHRKKDGAIFPVEITESFFSEGNLSIAVAFVRDITERVRAEETLRTSEERYRLISELISDYAFSYTVGPDHTLALEWSTGGSYERITGFAREEIPGRLALMLFHPEDRPGVQRELEHVLAGHTSSGEFRFVTKSGEVRWTHVYARPVWDALQDRVVRIYGVFQEVTERKRAEEELENYRENLEDLVQTRTAELAVAVERAEAADRLKSAFLASMSHELRTPLNSIIGFTGIILQGLVGPLNDEQKKQLGMVYSSSNHLLSLINDVLDISKIEAGQLQVACAPFDMRATIQKVIQALTPLAENKKLALGAEVAPEVGALTSDRRRVEQILINLVNNAIKFTEQGQVRVECLMSGGRLIMRVRDTGIGIKPEQLGNLFQPFYQIDTGISRRYEGTGLGLSICKKLAELLGGTIQVESEWGVGSTFTCILPEESRSQP